jgi:DNA-directed RNA polymerase subunit alpha
VPGVVEDTSELILNLKEVAIKLLERPETLAPNSPEEGPRLLRLARRGPGEVLAADIEVPADLEIVNKDLHIATLDNAEARLFAEMTVEVGRGYLGANEQEGARRPIGTIPVDAIFTPVRKVGFWVEPTRVGHLTDFNRLILEIRTNGAITPAEALSDAAKILDRYLILFFDFFEQPEEAGVVAPTADQSQLLETRTEDMDFSVRTLNCLKREKITTLAELSARTETELLGMRNFGRKSLDEVKEKLTALGLSLRPPEGESEEAQEDQDEEE